MFQGCWNHQPVKMLVDMKQTFQIILCILGQQRLNSIFLGCISTYSTPVAGTSRNCMGIVLKTKHLSSGYLTRTVVTTCTSFVLYLSELLGLQSLKGCRKVTIYIYIFLLFWIIWLLCLVWKNVHTRTVSCGKLSEAEWLIKHNI